jgi:DNA-binding ferritin-like protein (Dps family)
MNKLTKAQEATKDELVARLNKAKTDALALYAEVTEVIDRLNAEVTTYNEILGDLEGFRDELVGDMESYYDERSEKWQEGDAGSEYQSWKGEWEGLSVDEVPEVEAPDEPTMDHPDELENLSNEVA